MNVCIPNDTRKLLDAWRAGRKAATGKVVQRNTAIVQLLRKALEGVEPIALLRSPSTVTRGEKVNIIQHPRSRQFATDRREGFYGHLDALVAAQTTPADHQW